MGNGTGVSRCDRDGAHHGQPPPVVSSTRSRAAEVPWACVLNPLLCVRATAVRGAERRARTRAGSLGWPDRSDTTDE
jgi:hypothetical protein